MIDVLLRMAFLFFIGSIAGWVLELLFRRFVSAANPERKWINPGFLTGPYLPLYGFSLCMLYALSHIQLNFINDPVIGKICLFLVMSVCVTAIEFVAGEIFIRRMKIKLWDYDNEWGNIKGIICPKYSLYWAVLSAIYYFLIHPHILDSLYWLARHLAFSFFMGFFYGIFAIDLCYSLNVVARIKQFAYEYDVVVRYELLKNSFRNRNEEIKEKGKFIFPFKTDRIPFAEQFKSYMERYVVKEEERFSEAMKNWEEKKNKKQK